jgi:hypothetical protein
MTGPHFTNYSNKFKMSSVSEDTLKSAPGFDRERWPEEPDFGWLAKEFPVPMNVTGIGNDKLR